MNGVSTKVSASGRVVIPAEYRRELGMEPWNEVISCLEENKLRILTRAEAIRRAPPLVERHFKRNRSLVDELSAELALEGLSDHFFALQKKDVRPK